MTLLRPLTCTVHSEAEITGSLHAMMDRRDAGLFTGRASETRLLEGFLAVDSGACVAFVHGPGGIGKSMLLREAVRRARPMGYRIHWVDGRSADAAEQALSVASKVRDEAVLMVVDTYEAIQAVDADLRGVLSAEPSSRGRALIGGRLPPSGSWEDPPWNKMMLSLRLGPLSQDEAAILVERRGARAPTKLIDWARGEPLALSVAADALSSGTRFDPHALGDDEGIARALLGRLAAAEVNSMRSDILVAASVARAVDGDALRAMLPRVEPQEATRWLRQLSFTEELDARVAVHARVREAVRTLIRTEDPGHYRELRRRLVDHLHRRAHSGGRDWANEMADLVDDPRLRWGLGVEQAATHRAGPIRPGDEKAVAAVIETNQPRRWSYLRRWFRESPQHIVAVRDEAGDLTGVGIYVTVDDAPPWSDEDPVLGRWLADARTGPGPALLIRAGLPVQWTPGRAAVGNSALLARRDLEPRRIYGLGYRHNPDQIAFVEAMGYRRREDLDVNDGEVAVESHVLYLDHGVADHVRVLVYRDLGLPTAIAPDIRMSVREALRRFHNDESLSSSPLATGGTVSERSESVRDLLRRGVSSAFGDSAEERLLRATIERGYLAAGSSHEATARALHLARSTYFRHLAKAVERLTAYVEHL